MIRQVSVLFLAALISGCSMGQEPWSRPQRSIPLRASKGQSLNIQGHHQPLKPPVVTPRPILTSGFEPGINGEDQIEPPWILKLAEKSDSFEEPIAQPIEGEAFETNLSVDRSVATDDDAETKPEEDPNVQQSATWPSTEPILGEWIARVGRDVISQSEFETAIALQLLKIGPQAQQIPAEQLTLMKASVLDQLIDRSLVIQKARRNQLKDPKVWKQIKKAGAEEWEKKELPLLLKRFNAADRFELEEIFADRGLSIDEIVDSHALSFIFAEYLKAEVAPKISVSLPEMRTYYAKHRNDAAFQQDAVIKWYEIFVDTSKYPSRAEAMSEAQSLLEMLQKGHDFRLLARERSDAPNAGRDGYWETSPGGYAVTAVNDALKHLQPGQVSQVIEGPSGFHIIQLERFEPAGQRSFQDVQDAIRAELQGSKYMKLISDYLDELYRGAVVTTVFDGYQPRHLRVE